MKNLVMFVFLVFTISGLLTPSIFSSSFATPEDASGRDKGTKVANGCEKGTAKNNPNCGTLPPNGSDLDGDGILDVDDACPQIPNAFLVKGQPDHDNDGIPDSRDSTPCPVV